MSIADPTPSNMAETSGGPEDASEQTGSDAFSTQDGKAGPSYAQQLRDERAQQRQEFAEQKKETDALCEQHRGRVQQLEPMTRVMYEKPDGTVTRMDDNDRLEGLNESKTFLAENCNK